MMAYLVCRCKMSRGATQSRQSPTASLMQVGVLLILIRRFVALVLPLVVALAPLMKMERLP